MARPTNYSREIADTILRFMVDGMNLKEICRSEGMPPASTVRQWALDDRDGFAARYGRARELLVEHWFDEMIETADDSTNDWIERRRGDGSTEMVFNREHLERSKLRVETRKWALVKLLPKRYGDKQAVEHSGGLTLQDLVLEAHRGRTRDDQSPDGGFNSEGRPT